MKKLFALLVISTMVFSACATTRWIRTPLAKEKTFVVTLEQQKKDGNIISGKYAHPRKVNAAELARFLGDLTYTEQPVLFGSRTPEPVFQAEEIQRLVPALADALQKADDSQRVRFTSYNKKTVLLFSVNQKTEGVLFVAPDNRLHLAFAAINAAVEADEGANTIPRDFSGIDPLRVRNAVTVLEPPPAYGQPHRLESGRKAPMWVTADMDALRQSSAEKPLAPPAVSEKSDAPGAAFRPEPDQTRPPAETATLPLAEKPSRDMIQKEVKEKLRYFKNLLDEGLISQQDYEARKTELLNKIP